MEPGYRKAVRGPRLRSKEVIGVIGEHFVNTLAIVEVDLKKHLPGQLALHTYAVLQRIGNLKLR
jgi:hypothetical protein